MATTFFPDPTLMLKSLVVRPVEREEEARYQVRMTRHHYLGALPRRQPLDEAAAVHLSPVR